MELLWNAYLEVNGELAWEFLEYDRIDGGIIYDYTIDQQVLESTGNGEWLDITDICTFRENTFTYSHFTSGDGLVLKIRITTP